MAEVNCFKDIDEISLLRIFSNLPIKSLNSCKLVCKKWHKLVNETIPKRSIKINTVLYTDPESTNQESTSEVVSNKNAFVDVINAQFNELELLPDYCLFFLTNAAQIIYTEHKSDDSEESKRSNARKKAKIEMSICDKLKLLMKFIKMNQDNCLFVFTSGVIGTNLSIEQTQEVESFDNELAISGLLLPKSDLYRIKQVKFIKSEPFPKFDTHDEFNRLFDESKENEEIKHILILVHKSNRLQIRNLFKYLNTNHINKFAVSGGYVDKFECGNCDDENTRIVCIVLYGHKEHVNVAQVVVPWLNDHSNDINKRYDYLKDMLNRLKQTNVYRSTTKCSFAYQMSCYSRGQSYYEQLNCEANLFRTFFKNVRLIGLFGYGEIGVDYLPDYNTSDKYVNNTESKIEMLGYTTIFTIISIN